MVDAPTGTIRDCLRKHNAAIEAVKALNADAMSNFRGGREAPRQPTDSRRRNFEPGEGDRNVLLGGGLFDYFSPSSTPS